MMTVSQTLHYS